MGSCCDHNFHEDELQVKSFRRILWIVLIINAVMFVAEFATAFYASSVALQADALDFLGDSITYAITLMVLGSALRVRAYAALFKGVSMGVLGLWVYGRTIVYMLEGRLPVAEMMGTVGVIALGANVISAFLLYRYRAGDSNMRSIWLCSRNDAIGNLAIIVAASGVFALGSGWPDFIVAGIMATLSVSASIQIIRHAREEIRSDAAVG